VSGAWIHAVEQQRVEVGRVAEWERHGEHPLADRDFGKDSIHEVSRRVCHAPSRARRARAAPFAGKGQQAVVATTVAVQPQEPMSEYAALEVGAKLSFDERRDGRSLLTRVREERFELFANHFVKKCLFGSVANAIDHGLLAGTAGTRPTASLGPVVRTLAGRRENSTPSGHPTTASFRIRELLDRL
jgi:hypothetical protein